MKHDAIIRAFREQPALFDSFQGLITDQKDKILARVTSAPTAEDLFRLQGELRALTNLISQCKTLLGNDDARTNGKSEARR